MTTSTAKPITAGAISTSAERVGRTTVASHAAHGRNPSTGTRFDDVDASRRAADHARRVARDACGHEVAI